MVLVFMSTHPKQHFLLTFLILDTKKKHAKNDSRTKVPRGKKAKIGKHERKIVENKEY